MLGSTNGLREVLHWFSVLGRGGEEALTIKTLCYSPSRTSGDKKAKQNKIKSMSLLACFKRKSDMLHMVSVVGGRGSQGEPSALNMWHLQPLRPPALRACAMDVVNPRVIHSRRG